MWSQPCPSLALGKLALPLPGHCWIRHLGGLAPPFTSEGELTDPDGTSVGELALPPHLRQAVLVAWTEQLSYHPGFELAYPNIYPI